MSTRRKFLGALPVGLLSPAYAAAWRAQAEHKSANAIELSPSQTTYRPLEEISVRGTASGHLAVLDGEGKIYVERETSLPASFLVGGALGTHTVLLFGPHRELLGHASFYVDTKTEIREASGEYQHLLDTLHWTMVSDGFSSRRHDGKLYSYWADWLLDNTNTLKGMRYFSPDIRSSFEMFSKTQREDGMIWENHIDRTPPQSYWDYRFGYGDFSRATDGGFVGLRRSPIENHVEMYFLEALYLVWKSTGDDAWMKQHLDAALRAVHYSTNDPYRWSKKFGLLKRGLTIDTWDFLCESEAAITGNIMVVDLEKTHFGIFFGDNTGLIAGCRYLAEMLDRAERASDATAMRTLAAQMETRLNRVSWNGRFYTHWVPEDGEFRPDLGVDMKSQLSLSNAYSLNRGISEDHAHAIIKSYAAVREQMPKTSPGEFYSIYPPFGQGFGKEQQQWDYVNGGVLACTAGELARGCFEHGSEAYGADILQRVHAITKRHHDFLPGILRGKEIEAPSTKFIPLDLSALANCDTGQGTKEVPGWVNETGNYLIDFPAGAQTFRGVDFKIASGEQNGHRVCVGLSQASPYAQSVQVPVHQSCRSFYLLHAGSGGRLTGKLTIQYKDGRKQVEYIEHGVNGGPFWTPEDSEFNYRYGPISMERIQVAWRGKSKLIANVGVWITSFEPKHVDAEIASMLLESVENGSKWFVIAATLSDQPPFLPPWNDVSSGMPNNWGAGCVTAALIEGLAGVEDAGGGFREARISPRWFAAGSDDVQVDVRYPASRGYMSYHYRQSGKTVVLHCTSCADTTTLRVLLPPGSHVKQARLNSKPVPLRSEVVQESRYALADLRTRGVHQLEIDLEFI